MTSRVDPSRLAIRLLADGDAKHFADFRCGDTEDDHDLAAFLRDDAIRLQALSLVRTYLAFDGDRFVGYVSLLTDAVKLQSGERKKLKSGALRGAHQDQAATAALKVARLAVSAEMQNNGVGMRLLRFSLLSALEIAEVAGCRLLTLDALPIRVDYYEKRGFVRNLDKAYEGKERPSMRYDIFRQDPEPWALREPPTKTS